MQKRIQAVDVVKGQIVVLNGLPTKIVSVEHTDEYFAAAVFNKRITVSRTEWLELVGVAK